MGGEFSVGREQLRPFAVMRDAARMSMRGVCSMKREVAGDLRFVAPPHPGPLPGGERGKSVQGKR
jgi:hypothetical protein